VTARVCLASARQGKELLHTNPRKIACSTHGAVRLVVDRSCAVGQRDASAARAHRRQPCYERLVLRYFVPHGESLELPSPLDTGLARPVDAFVLGEAGLSRRVIVARDLMGELVVVDEDGPGGLPDAIRFAVGHHELARGRPPRFVDATQVWLLAIDLLEQASDGPGTNDPLQLYGRLSGPWGAKTTAHACNGQLTVTRGDLLRGFAEGAEQPFLVPGGAIFHAAVPGGLPEDLAGGHGIVLAYALLPLDAGGFEGGNESSALQIFHGLVHAFHDDLRRQGSRHAFAQRTLPVDDQRTLAARLQAEGFTIRDGVAWKRSGLFARERRPLPPEWTIDDIGPVAREALSALASGFPDPRSAALWARIQPASPASAFVPTSGSPTWTPAPPRRSPKTVVEQPFRRRDPDWMNDFATSTTAVPPRRTRVSPPSSTATRGPAASSDRRYVSKPDWMKDFE
jgi:hypothetical protein